MKNHNSQLRTTLERIAECYGKADTPYKRQKIEAHTDWILSLRTNTLDQFEYYKRYYEVMKNKYLVNENDRKI